MSKIIFWVVVIVGGLLAARLLAHYNHSKHIASSGKDPRKVKRGATQAKPVESMVRCEHCGIHLPRSEAVLSSGRTWCSQEHARLGNGGP